MADESRDKSSFDRFGDDLTEHILGYLSIEDSFRFECLNRRIASFIFNKQYELYLKNSYRGCGHPCLVENPELYYYIKSGMNMIYIKDPDKKFWETFFDKLIALETIILDGIMILDKKVIKVIGDKCQNLRRIAIKYHIHTEKMIDIQHIIYLFERCGPKIESLYFDLCFSDDINCMITEAILKLTPNLVYLRPPCTQIIMNCKVNLPKLKNLKSDLNKESLRALAHGNFENMRSIQSSLDFFQMKERDIHQIIQKFTKFPKLVELKLNIDFIDGNQFDYFCDAVKAIGKDMTELKTMSIELHCDLQYEEFLKVFSDFKGLLSLSVDTGSRLGLSANSPFNNTTLGSVAYLSKLNKLKQLNLSNKFITDYQLANIGSILPLLKHLSLSTKSKLTNKTLEAIAQLKLIKILHIFICDDQDGEGITESGVKTLLNCCPRLRFMTFLGTSDQVYSYVEEELKRSANEKSRMFFQAIFNQGVIVIQKGKFRKEDFVEEEVQINELGPLVTFYLNQTQQQEQQEPNNCNGLCCNIL